jgi:hypothetical protein
MPRLYLLSLLLLLLLNRVYSADDDAANDDAVNDDAANDDAANDDAAAGDDAYAQAVVPCEKGVVQVTGISLLCNSPYTYYWGNGANRNSVVCDYGDKAQIEVSFTVTDDLDGDIYMTMAASYENEQLYLGESVELCYNYVGESCSAAGDYTFKKKIQFAYLDGSYEKFVPKLEIAFSDSADGSYSLGGVNIYCQENDDADDDNNNNQDWSANNNEVATLSSVQVFFMNYGILVGTVVVMSGFSLFLWYHNRGESSAVTAENSQGLLA